MGNFYLKSLTALSLIALTACSSGGGNSSAAGYVPDSQLFMASSPNATLDVIGLDRTTDTLFTDTTSLNAPNILVGGRLDGTVSYSYVRGANNTIALTSGGNANIEDQGNQYAFRFGDANMVGIAGIPATSMPSGSATYTGFADVSANDGSGSPKVLTNASTTANFNTGKVNVYLSNAGSDWIRITGADISGNGYADGALSVSPSFATDPVTSGTLAHQGKFFNGNAEEIGGVFILDRTPSITFKAQGVYGGSRN